MKKNIRERLNIPFTQGLETELLADLYLPETEADQPLYPAVILIHGGAWQAGSKEMYKEWGPYLAERGFAALAIDYRLSAPEKPSWPGVFEDVQAAYSWLLKNAAELKLDINRIAVIGDSVGAQLAYLLALQTQAQQSGKINCAVGVYGVYDCIQWWEYTQKVRTDNPVGKCFGAAPHDAPDLYKEASPIYRMQELADQGQRLDIHSFIIWGDKDITVEPVQSEEFIKVLEKVAPIFETVVIPDVGHFWFTILPNLEGGRMEDEPNRTVAPQIIDFLNRHL